jgi:hypothetical protein
LKELGHPKVELIEEEKPNRTTVLNIRILSGHQEKGFTVPLSMITKRILSILKAFDSQ